MPRAYRNLRNSSKFERTVSCKDGIIQGRQRYFCQGCGYRYTVRHRAGTSDATVRRQALQLYLEGLGFRSIGRILHFSNVAVLKWIRAFGAQLEAVRRTAPVQVMELEEMQSYIGSKKTVTGYGWLLIELQGDASTVVWGPAIRQRGKRSGSLWGTAQQVR